MRRSSRMMVPPASPGVLLRQLIPSRLKHQLRESNQVVLLKAVLRRAKLIVSSSSRTSPSATATNDDRGGSTAGGGGRGVSATRYNIGGGSGSSQSRSNSSTTTTIGGNSFGHVRRKRGDAPIDALTSIGFSGAGFLGSYHLGVADCLTRHTDLILGPGEIPPSSPQQQPLVLLGASAGSLTAAGIAAGVSAEDGMDLVLRLSRRVRQERYPLLDVLTPGISLVDYVHELLLPLIQKAIDHDEEYLLRRIDHGNLLHIALTDRSTLFDSNVEIPRPSSSVKISDAYCYVDRYRTLDDIMAACVLSSYIPGLTGPARGIQDGTNRVVKGSCELLDELTELGYVKYGHSNGRVDPRLPFSKKEQFWDGGLSNIWPTLDDDTVIVTPVQGDYSPNPSICPTLPQNNSMVVDDARRSDDVDNDAGVEKMNEADEQNGGGKVKQDSSEETKNNSKEENGLGAAHEQGSSNPTSPPPRRVLLHGRMINLDGGNAATFRRMALSSDEETLQQHFRDGYDHARAFLKRNNMLK